MHWQHYKNPIDSENGATTKVPGPDSPNAGRTGECRETSFDFRDRVWCNWQTQYSTQPKFDNSFRKSDPTAI